MVCEQNATSRLVSHRLRPTLAWKTCRSRSRRETKALDTWNRRAARATMWVKLGAGSDPRRSYSASAATRASSATRGARGCIDQPSFGLDSYTTHES